MSVLMHRCVLFERSMGAAVVVGNVYETHNQQLLRSHDEEINVLAMSNTGALLASAQVCSKRRQVCTYTYANYWLSHHGQRY